MSSLVILLAFIFLLPLIIKRELDKKRYLEEEDRREREELALLRYIAGGRVGPPPQVNRVPNSKGGRRRGESHFDHHRRVFREVFRAPHKH